MIQDLLIPRLVFFFSLVFSRFPLVVRLNFHAQPDAYPFLALNFFFASLLTIDFFFSLKKDYYQE